MLSALLLTVIASFFSLNVRAEYDQVGSKVISLNGGTFNDVVHKNERPFMVKFFAPYCGHCKKMIPAYQKLAGNLEGLVDVAAIDCTQSFNQATCSRYEVQGYPTIKLFVFNGKGNHKRAIDYYGSRSTDDMTNFIKKHAHSFIFKVSNTNQGKSGKWNVDLAAFFGKGESLPKLLLFRPDSKSPSTLLFRAVSIKYHYKIVVGEVSLADDSQIAKELGFESVQPGTLVFFPSGKQTPSVTYTGPVKRTELFAFIDAQLERASVVVKHINAASRKDINSACFEDNSEWCILIISGQESKSLVSSTVRGAQEKNSWTSSFTVVEIDASSGGSKILKSLNASNDLPAVVAVSGKQMKYALMLQDLSPSSLQSFIENVLASKVRFISFKNKELFVSGPGSDKDEL